jgi:uncharacterized membrane protein
MSSVRDSGASVQSRDGTRQTVSCNGEETPMSLYTLALFVHVCGALGLFAGLGALLFGAAALQRAQRVEQVRMLAMLITVSGNLTAISIVILGIAGFSMAVTVWGIRATWIIVATISFVPLLPGSLLVINPRVRAIARQAREAPDGLLPKGLALRVRDPLLVTGLSVYVACLFGIVFLMTNKPPLATSLVVMMVALALGLALGVPLWLAARRAPASHARAE